MSKDNVGYGATFLDQIYSGSYSSAIVLLERLREFCGVESIIDFGCGPGAWLTAARDVFKLEPNHSVGVDGSYAQSRVEALGHRFIACDFRKSFVIAEHADLCICLEVAEHLPAARAGELVAALSQAAPKVMFSAAMPLQGGTGHLNEQYLDYWISMFGQHEMDVFDIFRPSCWTNSAVLPWYAQNAVVFVAKTSPLHAVLNESMGVGLRVPATAYHPGIFRMASVEECGLRRYVEALPGKIKRFASRGLLQRLISGREV